MCEERVGLLRIEKDQLESETKGMGVDCHDDVTECGMAGKQELEADKSPDHPCHVSTNIKGVCQRGCGRTNPQRFSQCLLLPGYDSIGRVPSASFLSGHSSHLHPDTGQLFTSSLPMDNNVGNTLKNKHIAIRMVE